MNAPIDPHTPDPEFVEYLERDIARAARHQGRFPQRLSFLGSSTLPKFFTLAACMAFMLAAGLVWGVGTGFAAARNPGGDGLGLTMVRATPVRRALAALSCGEPEPTPVATVPARPPVKPLPEDVAEAFKQQGDTLVRRASAPVHKGVAPLLKEVGIGVADGEDNYMIGAVADVAVGRNGEMYIWDRSVPTIRMYDATGKFVRNIGRRGSGPGEYRNGAAIAIAKNGNLLQWDPGNGRINVYNLAGEPSASWSTVSGVRGMMLGSDLMKVDTAGFIYLQTYITKERAGQAPEITSAWVRFNPDGSLRDTIFVPRSPQVPLLEAVSASGGQFSTRIVPFAPNDHHKLSPLGYVVTGLSNRIAIDLHEPRKPLVSIRRDARGQPVSARERDSARAEITESMRKLQPGWSWNGPEIPRTKPLYEHLIVAADGRIWIQVAEGPSPPQDSTELRRGQMMMTQTRIDNPNQGVRREPAWTCPAEGWSRFEVYEPSGRFLGTVEIPQRVEPVVMRGDFVWGATCTNDDIPQVVRYRIAWK